MCIIFIFSLHKSMGDYYSMLEIEYENCSEHNLIRSSTLCINVFDGKYGIKYSTIILQLKASNITFMPISTLFSMLHILINNPFYYILNIYFPINVTELFFPLQTVVLEITVFMQKYVFIGNSTNAVIAVNCQVYIIWLCFRVKR